MSEQPAPRTDRPSWWAAAVGAVPQLIAAVVGGRYYPEAFMPTSFVPDYAESATFVSVFYGPAMFALALLMMLVQRRRSTGLGLLIGASIGLVVTAGVCVVGAPSAQ